MRILLGIVLAGCLPALAQQDTDAKLESLVAEAQRAQARSDYRVAAEAYRQALSIRPDLAALWSNLGLMEFESHEFSQAEEAFRRAVGLDKSLFVPNLFLGLALLELKRPREAIGYLLAAEKLKPQDAQVLLALGRSYHTLSNATRSREWYQRAAELAPGNADAWFGLGVAYLDLVELSRAKLAGDSAESPEVTALKALAIAALARADDAEPNSLTMHALVGDVYQRRRMFREAEEEYSKMLALDPSSVAALAGLATADLHEGRLDKAQAAVTKAHALDPQDSEINLLTGEVLVARHEYTEAEPYLQHSLHARSDLLPRAHALLGRIYARTGRLKEAISELTQGLASDEDGSVYYQLARLYQTEGDEKAAAVAFKKSEQMRAKREALARENLRSVQ